LKTKQNVNWKSISLGEIIDIYDNIRVPLSSLQRAEIQGEFPYYGASGVIDHVNDYLFDGEYILIAEDGENLNSRKLPIAFMARGRFWVNNHAHIVKAKKGIADDRFLIGWFAQADIKGYITGAAQPKLSQANLKRIVLSIPPLPTQRKIASILSAYDDLIENNTRRIAILEEMAQSIYREWFVNFRFPEHENAKFIDSPLGKIPHGWRVEKLKNVAEVNARSIKKGNEPDSINYIDIASVSTGSVDAVQAMSFSEAPGRARRIIRHGDIIWSTVRPNRKSYSLILNPLQNMIASTGFAVISGITAPHSYLYYALTTDGFVGYLVSNATGSAYPAVSSADFEKAAILIPSTNILQKFDEFVEPLLVSNYCFARKNTSLRTTRDLLLPKLISGQLDVEDIDIDTLEPLVDDQT
jgi:type I restriction enzyme S subunit